MPFEKELIKKSQTRRRIYKGEGVTIIPKKNPQDIAGTTKFSKFFLSEKQKRKMEEEYLASLPPRHLKDGGLLKVRSLSNLPPIYNFDDQSNASF